MTAKETIQIKLNRLQRPHRAVSRPRSLPPVLTLAAEGVIHFLLAAVLPNAVLMGNRAPFAVALVAASGSGLCGGCALLGATRPAP